MRKASGRLVCLGLLVMLGGCRQREMLLLEYELAETLAPGSIIRVVTTARPAEGEERRFIAEEPRSAIGRGVFAELTDVDGSGSFVLVLTHDSTRGFEMRPRFELTLLPTPGAPPPLLSFEARASSVEGLVGQTAAPVEGEFGRGHRLRLVVADLTCQGTRCGDQQACCDGACTEVLTSTSHCGACGQACQPTEVCETGSCRCGGGPGCTAGQTCCGAAGCIDLQNDPSNCGTCGHGCNAGEVCKGGQCTCESNANGAACGDGELCCPGVGCSTTGSCQCGTVACGLPNLCCVDRDKSTCTDVQIDPANCGQCGRACPPGVACVGGRCLCGSTVCNTGTCCGAGATAVCVNTMTDVQHCGGCGIRCGAGATCSAGTCRCPSAAMGAICRADPPNPPGNTCCNGSCFDLQHDDLNCGTCGRACGPAESCSGGKCLCLGVQCLPGQVCCINQIGVPQCTNGGCVTDPGACGSCAADEICCECQALPPECQKGNVCVCPGP